MTRNFMLSIRFPFHGRKLKPLLVEQRSKNFSILSLHLLMIEKCFWNLLDYVLLRTLVSNVF